MKNIIKKLLLVAVIFAGMTGFSAKAGLRDLYKSMWRALCSEKADEIATGLVTFFTVITCTKSIDYFLNNAQDRTYFFAGTTRFLSKWYYDDTKNLVKHLFGAGIITFGLALKFLNDKSAEKIAHNNKSNNNKQTTTSKKSKKCV